MGITEALCPAASKQAEYRNFTDIYSTDTVMNMSPVEAVALL